MTRRRCVTSQPRSGWGQVQSIHSDCFSPFLWTVQHPNSKPPVQFPFTVTRPCALPSSLLHTRTSSEHRACVTPHWAASRRAYWISPSHCLRSQGLGTANTAFALRDPKQDRAIPTQSVPGMCLLHSIPRRQNQACDLPRCTDAPALLHSTSSSFGDHVGEILDVGNRKCLSDAPQNQTQTAHFSARIVPAILLFHLILQCQYCGCRSAGRRRERSDLAASLSSTFSE